MSDNGVGPYLRLRASRDATLDVYLADPVGGDLAVADFLHDCLARPERMHLVADRGAVAASDQLAEAVNRLQVLAPESTLLQVPSTERFKSIAGLRRLIEWFDHNSVGRRSQPVIALGGGSLLDTVAFAGAVYRRGVPVAKVPTSLVGMVDVSVAAKSGVNFYGRKNLIGSFSPPAAVILDPRLLASLPLRYIQSGLAEALKVAIVRDESLLQTLELSVVELLETRFQTCVGRDVIGRCIKSAAESIWSDLWESDLRRDMDFGHSFSKTFEEELHPRPTHGEAVALDMCLSAGLARAKDLIDAAAFSRVMRLVCATGLAATHPGIDGRMLRRALADTAVHRDGSRLVPLPGPLGAVQFSSIQAEDLRAARALLASCWR